jgi:hypothetical protein
MVWLHCEAALAQQEPAAWPGCPKRHWTGPWARNQHGVGGAWPHLVLAVHDLGAAGGNALGTD